MLDLEYSLLDEMNLPELDTNSGYANRNDILQLNYLQDLPIHYRGQQRLDAFINQA